MIYESELIEEINLEKKSSRDRLAAYYITGRKIEHALPLLLSYNQMIMQGAHITIEALKIAVWSDFKIENEIGEQ